MWNSPASRRAAFIGGSWHCCGSAATPLRRRRVLPSSPIDHVDPSPPSCTGMTEGSPGGVRDYVFDRTRANEERRLEKQAAIMDPFTDRLFRDGGLAEGMRVLDLGSGAGRVAGPGGQIGGPAGAVIGVEGSAVAIETARRRAAAAGVHHVTFVEGDVRELDRVFDPRIPPFDAVVGRFVL